MEPLMTFGEVLLALRDGKAVARREWEATGNTAFLVLIPGRTVEVSYEPMKSFVGGGTRMDVADHIDVIDMDIGSTRCSVGWQPLQADILADDWVLVEP